MYGLKGSELKENEGENGEKNFVIKSVEIFTDMKCEVISHFTISCKIYGWQVNSTVVSTIEWDSIRSLSVFEMVMKKDVIYHHFFTTRK